MPFMWLHYYVELHLEWMQKQETQLSLTNLATRLEVSQGHQTFCHSIYDSYGFQLVSYSNFVRKTSFWDIRLQKCRDLENHVRDPSRSLEMTSFDTAHMTSYWRSRVTMALFLRIQCRKYWELRPWNPSQGQSRSLNVAPFDRQGMVSY